jgi:hypothetical protein
VRYPAERYERWLPALMRFVADDERFAAFAASEAAQLAADLPAAVLCFERTPASTLKHMLGCRAERLVAQAIALNLHNAVVEVNLAKSLVAAELTGQTSSYLLFADRAWEELRAAAAGAPFAADVVRSFVANVGFLYGPDDDRSREQGLLKEFSARGGSGTGQRFGPLKFRIEAAFAEVAAASRAHRKQRLLIALTEVEEFRHYWQARLFRSWPDGHPG